MRFYELENGRMYVSEEDVRPATLEDCIENCSRDYLGIYEGDDGDYYYSEDDSKANMDDLVDGLFVIQYWTGSNYKTDIYSYMDMEKVEIELIEREDLNPKPAVVFVYELRFHNGDTKLATFSNISGKLSPYYKVMEEEYYETNYY